MKSWNRILCSLFYALVIFGIKATMKRWHKFFYSLFYSCHSRNLSYKEQMIRVSLLLLSFPSQSELQLQWRAETSFSIHYFCFFYSWDYSHNEELSFIFTAVIHRLVNHLIGSFKTAKEMTTWQSNTECWWHANWDSLVEVRLNDKGRLFPNSVCEREWVNSGGILASFVTIYLRIHSCESLLITEVWRTYCWSVSFDIKY